MDALDILARFDAGQPVTPRELGYLLPELERRGHLEVWRTERHCNRVFARSYRYGGRQFLWVGPHLGNYEYGIAQVKAAAMEITPDIQTPTFLYRHDLQGMPTRPGSVFGIPNDNPHCPRGAADLHKGRLIRRPLM
jgi:hypothetical protein